MAIAYWCILIAGILPLATVAFAKAQRGYNNNDPRAFLERQDGMRKRADYAHRNHFEAFPLFAAAVFTAELTGGRAELIDTLAVVWVAARIAYTLFYLTDKAALRSVAFFVAYGCAVAMFVSAPFNL
ncbi:MAG TPA: MAPEG family protein [Burkholderiaceae bacterium]